MPFGITSKQMINVTYNGISHSISNSDWIDSVLLAKGMNPILLLAKNSLESSSLVTQFSPGVHLTSCPCIKLMNYQKQRSIPLYGNGIMPYNHGFSNWRNSRERVTRLFVTLQAMNSLLQLDRSKPSVIFFNRKRNYVFFPVILCSTLPRPVCIWPWVL